MIKNVFWASCEVPFIHIRIKWSLKFLRRLYKSLLISNFMKLRPVAAELFQPEGRTDGQTDRHDEANSRISQFCERV